MEKAHTCASSIGGVVGRRHRSAFTRPAQRHICENDNSFATQQPDRDFMAAAVVLHLRVRRPTQPGIARAADRPFVQLIASTRTRRAGPISDGWARGGTVRDESRMPEPTAPTSAPTCRQPARSTANQALLRRPAGLRAGPWPTRRPSPCGRGRRSGGALVSRPGGGGPRRAGAGRRSRIVHGPIVRGGATWTFAHLDRRVLDGRRTCGAEHSGRRANGLGVTRRFSKQPPSLVWPRCRVCPVMHEHPR